MSSPARFQIARGSKSTLRFGLAMAGLIVAVPLGIILFLLPHADVKFVCSPEGLRIQGDPYGRLIPRSDLILASARPLSLDSEPSYRPTTRTDGIALPDYRSGWYATEGAGKVLVFVADWTRAVVIPTRAGYSLIIAPDNGYGLIEDLRRGLGGTTEYPLAPSDPDNRQTLAVATFWGLLLGLPLLIATLMVVLCVGTRRVVFEVTPDHLRIRGDLFGRKIPLASLRLDEARVVDLTAGPDRLTLLRITGMGLPGYLSGRAHALGHPGKYLVFLTNRSRVVRIPTTGGDTLLITPAAPESFLAALGVPAPSRSALPQPE